MVILGMVYYCFSHISRIGMGSFTNHRDYCLGWSSVCWMGCTLWLCQNSYWKWPIYSWFTHKKWWFSIVMLVYQRVNLHFPMVFLWFSYGSHGFCMGEWENGRLLKLWFTRKWMMNSAAGKFHEGFAHTKNGDIQKDVFFKGKAMISHGILMDLMPNCWTSPSDFVWNQ